HANRRARGAMSFIGLSLPKRIPNHTGKVGNSTQVSGTSDASKTQLGLIRSIRDVRDLPKRVIGKPVSG
ncbi:MAG TPA: hypothetical protein VEI73_09095, partial [Candidatus Acidoferrum sp.]|nr:hypothetical protein [Candidatus Acidoferrum sp.]